MLTSFTQSVLNFNVTMWWKAFAPVKFGYLYVRSLWVVVLISKVLTLWSITTFRHLPSVTSTELVRTVNFYFSRFQSSMEEFFFFRSNGARRSSRQSNYFFHREWCSLPPQVGFYFVDKYSNVSIVLTLLLCRIATVMRNSGCEVPEYMLQMKKTSRSDAKKMARKVPTRKTISTEPLPDKIKRKKRERIIANVRKNKQNGQQGPSSKKQKILANNV